MKKDNYINPSMKIKYFGKECVAAQQSGLPPQEEEYIEALESFGMKAQVNFGDLVRLN